jgi:5-methyltetrahydrofolate--homocysteine methyltransferase
MYDLREAVCALSACKAIADLPVLVNMAFNTEKNEGRTIMGDTAGQCAKQLSTEGANAIGSNCGNIDPQGMAYIIAQMARETDLPLVAEPNAGKPKLVKGAATFDMAPEEFVKGILQCVEAGARIIGGCCGTTPAHIQAVAGALNA